MSCVLHTITHPTWNPRWLTWGGQPQLRTVFHPKGSFCWFPARSRQDTLHSKSQVSCHSSTITTDLHSSLGFALSAPNVERPCRQVRVPPWPRHRTARVLLSSHPLRLFFPKDRPHRLFLYWRLLDLESRRGQHEAGFTQQCIFFTAHNDFCV